MVKLRSKEVRVFVFVFMEIKKVVRAQNSSGTQVYNLVDQTAF